MESQGQKAVFQHVVIDRLSRIFGPAGWASLVPVLAITTMGDVQVRAEDLKADTLQRVKHAAVLVFTAKSEREKGDHPLSSGSGFFINSTGLVMTNNHVVDPTHGKSDAEKQQFHYQGGRLTWTIVTDAGTEAEKTYEAMVLYQSESADQALLQSYESEGIKYKSPNYLRLLPESRLESRMKVWALGFPGGDRQRTVKDKHPEVSVTMGNVLQAPRTPGGRIRMVYTDVIARPGNSGGPMVDQDGFLVGTVTLMTKPEGREDTGGANYSALVPAKITGQMVRNSFLLSKILPGTDVTPFMDALIRPDGRVNIPEFARKKDQDVLFFDDGDRIFGEIATETIKWDSKMGMLEVPTSAVAYVMTNSDGSHLFMEGGNRIAASEAASTYSFRPEGGAPIEGKFKDVAVVGFKTKGRKLEPLSGEAVVVDTDLCHLVLTEVKGTVPFETRIGKIDVALTDLYRVDRRDEGDHVLLLNDGRRMTGRFGDGRFEGKIGATGTSISFHLTNVGRATVERVHHRGGSAAGLSLRGVLEDADPTVGKVVAKLQTGDHSSACALLGDFLGSADFKSQTELKKDQARLLEAVCALRAGTYDEAMKGLRKVSRSSDENLSTFANAYVSVLKRFEDHQFEGRPLSDPLVVAAAGASMAQEQIQTVRRLLRDARHLEGKTRGEFKKGIGDIKRYEDPVRQSAVFAGTDADDEVIRLWKHGVSLSEREIRRASMALQEAEENSRGGSGQGTQLAMRREVDELREQAEEAAETRGTYLGKLWGYGFRIDDQDIQAMKEEGGGVDD